MRHYSSRKPPTPILTHILQEDQILGWEIRSRDWGRQRSGLLVSTGATTSGARHPGTVPSGPGPAYREPHRKQKGSEYGLHGGRA